MHTPSWRHGGVPSTGQRYRAGRRGPPRLAALAALAALAGCGTVPAAGGGSSGGSAAQPATSGGTASSPAVPGTAPAGPPAAGPTPAGPAALCADSNVISRLVIVRSRGMNRIQELHFPFPDQVIVTSPATARAVARAVCALPAMPGGAVNCPAMLLGTSYQLTFTAAGARLPVVTAEATGCQTVTGAGPPRRASAAPGFWRALGNAMGLYAAGPPVFRGDGPASSQCQSAQSGLRMVSGCPARDQPGYNFRKAS